VSELLDKIKSRGYWHVIIRPGTFMETRIANIKSLYPILQKNSVQLRGWDFPHLDTHNPLQIDVDWIGQEPEWEEYLELWRFYQSGQFVVFRGIDEDWLDQSQWRNPIEGWKPGQTLSVEEVVIQFAEIFEFAARLSFTDAGDDVMRLDITIAGLHGRSLHVERSRHMRKGYIASIDELPYQIDLSRLQLLAEPRELSLTPAIELFRRFGWDPSLEVLRDIQEQFLRRGSTVVR
jgi:hypothetical protein